VTNMPSRKQKEEMPFQVREQVKLLQNDYTDVRMRAATALGGTRHASAIPYLAKALRDDSGDVRKNAAWALGQIGHPSAIPHMTSLLQDKEILVRLNTAWALGKIGHASAVPPLAKALQDSDHDVRWRAVWALVKIGQSLQDQAVKGKEAKALQLVAPYLHQDEEPELVRKAYTAALEGKVTPANIRLYLKQLRALKGKLK